MMGRKENRVNGRREAYFRVESSGVSLVSLGTSLGLSSCWVRDGLGL